MVSMLPAERAQREIIDLVTANPVCIIAGATGCGKSSKVPVMLQRYFKAPVLCTQPRRIAAVSLATRVAEELGVALGAEVGYHIGQRNVSHSSSEIVFSTTGILWKDLLANGTSLPYKVICVDECHERSVESDLILSCLKMLCGRDQAVKLVVMSATMDVGKYMRYFGLNGDAVFRIPEYVGAEGGPGLPVTRDVYLDYMPEGFEFLRQVDFKVKGLKEIVPVMQKAVVEAVRYIHTEVDRESTTNGSILVFLPTYRMLIDVNEMLLRDGMDVTVHCLHSSVDVQLCMELINKSAHGAKRSVILTSNISESSLTFDNCAYVVDPGLTIQVAWQKNQGYTSDMVWVSKSQANQRRGRTGRTCAGTCYRLIPKKFYDGFHEYEKPQLSLSNLRNETLAHLCSDVPLLRHAKRVFAECLDPPAHQRVDEAFAFLESFGACSIKTGQRSHVTATPVGEFIAELPFGFEASLLILNGARLGVLYESIVLAAIVSNTPHPIVKHVGTNVNDHQQKFGISGESALLLGNLAAVDFYNIAYVKNHRLNMELLSEMPPFWEISEEEAQFARDHHLVANAVQNVLNQVDIVVGVLHKFRPTFLKDLYATMFHASGHSLDDDMYTQFGEALNFERVKGHQCTGSPCEAGIYCHFMLHYGSKAERIQFLIDNQSEMTVLHSSQFSSRVQSNVPICRFGNSCKYGSSCRFRHAAPNQDKDIKVAFEWMYGGTSLLPEVQKRYVNDSNVNTSLWTSCEPIKNTVMHKKLSRSLDKPIIATGLDSLQTLVQVYGEGIRPRLKVMETLYGATVELGVDATQLHARRYTNLFSNLTSAGGVVLVWMFPYTGKETNEVNSALVRDFFKSVRARFHARRGLAVKVLLGLCNDQFSRWDVIMHARDQCFMLMDSYPFDGVGEGWGEYQPRDGEQDKGFKCEHPTVFEFYLART
ncbi:hypothetical protein HDU79_003708 [Rhizoclosmatium sp. JEL0117]|nr:hypothetical protein HDU79_003708 [Rhizoclosmatium sp. JEL0117]